ncbi:hypothetical protein V5N11_022680 [Cardamine amara subsp. amara]|uniref:Uncharacterized protein n=1 Tax=Cardamine amara subsp. amara TaxID=228776 RepID=A0ABD1BBQ6_CARAN
MNATKFVVLILIGVVCANVSAIRQPKEVSKETKVGISVPKTAITNSVGTELHVIVTSVAYNEELTGANAKIGPGGPGSKAYAGASGGSGGTVVAIGPNAVASSRSFASAKTSSVAVASPDGSITSGTASGRAGTYARGHIGDGA